MLADRMRMVGGGKIPLWVIAGQSGKLSTSSDGINWVARTNGFGSTTEILDIAYGNGLYVAISAAKIATSPDGIIWTERTPPLSNMSCIIFANNKFVIGNTSGSVSYSTDGINWTTNSTGYIVQSIAYGNGTWVIGTSSAEIVAYSTNLVTWIGRSLPLSSQSVFDIGYGNGLFVASGGSGTLATSPDGINWTARTSNLATTAGYNITVVVYRNGLWVATSVAGEMATSVNGTTWTKQTGYPLISSVVYDIDWINGLWVAVGDQGKLSTSPDLATWTPRTSAISSSYIINTVVVG